MELFLDGEIKWSIINRYGIGSDIPKDDPYHYLKMEIALQRFLGYDYVSSGIEGFGFPRDVLRANDTTDIENQKRSIRGWTDEHKGPVNSWEDFEKYQQDFAKGLQKAHKDRYDGKFGAFRTLLEEI